jgi:hypothetical protein
LPNSSAIAAGDIFPSTIMLPISYIKWLNLV